MSDLNRYYKPAIPFGIRLMLFVIVGLCFSLVGVGIISILRGPIFTVSESLSQQGNFFGGYLTAVVGLLTLSAVVWIGFRQSQQQERYFLRQYFLQGTELISSSLRNHDDLQALRVIDYYSRLATSNQDEELFLVLNTILMGKIRKQLEQPEKHILNNYPFAVEAISKIGEIQREKALNRKARQFKS